MTKRLGKSQNQLLVLALSVHPKAEERRLKRAIEWYKRVVREEDAQKR